MTSEEIFNKYIEDECPCCNEFVSSESYYTYDQNGGKCTAMYFRCDHCGSEYTIGLNRNRLPINSEITLNLFKKL